MNKKIYLYNLTLYDIDNFREAKTAPAVFANRNVSEQSDSQREKKRKCHINNKTLTAINNPQCFILRNHSTKRSCEVPKK